MDDFKKFTKQESLIYDEAIKTLSAEVEHGTGYEDAVNRLAIEDSQLKQLISDDFLKILIVKLHYEKGMTLKEVASKLSVTHELIVATKNEMLEEVQGSAIKAFHSDVKWGNA
ncbi:MAG: hypothetical protein HQK88_08410 [Nitrospirae bacterium]|nr:hypothetical protein [Nitrospirota bacterium]MBF0534908.1 hypothetical protein [Nitrospirota bacterium]MBF0616823.1 hypothetical protein [Nitrospirota bacterium]